MRKANKVSLLVWAVILLFLLFSLVGWGSLYAQRKAHPKDAALYGTFGTDRIVNFATYLTFDGDHFSLYLGEGGKALDEGTWAMSEDTAVLHGQDSVYDLVIKGNFVYLCGGDFDRMTRFEKFENNPVFTTVGLDPSSGQDGETVPIQ